MVKITRRSGIILSLAAAGLLAGCATNLQRGQEAGRAGDYQAMLQHCQMAAKEKNPNPQAFRCIGDAQMRLGNRGKAETAYLTYLDNIPDDTDVRLQLVEMYMESGRYPAAQTHVEKVLQFDPSSYRAHYLLGEIHRTNKLCASAEDAYERALEINPGYFQAKAGLEKVDEICPPVKPPRTVVKPPVVKKEKVFKGGGKALKESEW